MVKLLGVIVVLGCYAVATWLDAPSKDPEKAISFVVNYQ